MVRGREREVGVRRDSGSVDKKKEETVGGEMKE